MNERYALNQSPHYRIVGGSFAAMSSNVWPLSTPAAVERIRTRNRALGAYVTTRCEEALEEAALRAPQPPLSPLHGVPYGLKDEWDTAGLATTGGSHRHRHRIPTTNSPVFEVFQRAGAILVGKTNLSDLGLAPEATNYIVGAARNPHDTRCTAGGSSGGAAAAVADGMEAFDWGTDIGGSIRMPAAFCGVLGMRLSSETWPIKALFPKVPPSLAWMCGQGPFSRSIDQMRQVLGVAATDLRSGPPRAAFTPTRWMLHAPDRLGKWPTFAADVTPHVNAAVGCAPRPAQGLLAPSTLVRAVYGSLWASHFEDLLAADETITMAEGLRAVVSSIVLRGSLGDKRFHPTTAELLALIALGRFTIFHDRRSATKNARAIRAQFEEVWASGSVVIAPVCVYPAPRIGRTNWNADLLSCTTAGNIADSTALAIPLGTFDNGLPRGLQLMGPPGSEDALLDLAERFIASRDHALTGSRRGPAS